MKKYYLRFLGEMDVVGACASDYISKEKETITFIVGDKSVQYIVEEVGEIILPDESSLPEVHITVRVNNNIHL